VVFFAAALVEVGVESLLPATGVGALLAPAGIFEPAGVAVLAVFLLLDDALWEPLVIGITLIPPGWVAPLLVFFDAALGLAESFFFASVVACCCYLDVDEAAASPVWPLVWAALVAAKAAATARI
jgi:hypothetical protein